MAIKPMTRDEAHTLLTACLDFNRIRDGFRATADFGAYNGEDTCTITIFDEELAGTGQTTIVLHLDVWMHGVSTEAALAELRTFDALRESKRRKNA